MSTIKTGTTLTTAYQVEGDTTGALVIQTGGTPTTAATFDSSQNTTVAGNLTLSGAGKRITGDFSNATAASRAMFQSSTTNGITSVEAIPNGTATQAQWNVANTADPTNTSIGQFSILSTDVRLMSAARGTGSYIPLTFHTGGSERVRVDTSGNFMVGTTTPRQNITSAQNSTIGTGIEIENLNSGSNTTKTAFLNFSGHDTVNAYKATAQILSGPADTNYTGSYLSFSTRGSDVFAERMRIDGSGYVTLPGSTASAIYPRFSVGVGTGAAALTVNDGYGNCNVAFNHTAGIPDTSGSSCRIVTDVDSTSAGFRVQMGSNTTAGVAVGLTTAMQIDSSYNFAFNSGYGSVAIAYGCRAWVNFNGTGTVAIRASGNVSSITDNGTGDYTVNFTNAMPDADYSVVASTGTTGTNSDSQFFACQKDTGNRTTSAVRLINVQHGTAGGWGPQPTDVSQFNVAVFR